MSQQIQKNTQHQKREQEETQSPEVPERDQKLTDDVEAILDEIDEVLEVNAEEFVSGFVQKGGQ